MATDAALSELRAALKDERDTLRAQLQELGFGDGDTGLEYDSNFADSSQVTAERGEAEVIATKLRETLEEVEHALGKFDDGTYGQCEECGEPIPPPRLEAKPAARVCINCASKR
jgi:RNA polymerase-binding transcription factor DksA